MRAVRAVFLVAVLLAPAAVRAELVYTNTAQVQAVAVDRGALWAGTRGGLEVWEVATLTRRRLYTTGDGLRDNDVQAVVLDGATVQVRTATAACVLLGERWLCRASLPPAAAPAAPELYRGRRVTARGMAGGRPFVATAGGLWVAGRRLTPEDQICSNHVVALAAFAGRIWFGSFDEGLCSVDGRGHHRRAAVSAPMINDLLVAGGLLYVATTHGLFATADGLRFRRVPGPGDRAVVDLATDGRALWAVTPASLWRLPLVPGCGVPRGTWMPGGARALQAVDVRAGTVWIATEDRGLLRQTGPRFQVLDRAAGLPSSWTLDVAVTPDGSAFAATLRDGLVRIDPTGHPHAVDCALDPHLLHVVAAGARLWVGTQSGAAVVDPRDGSVAPLEGLPHPSVHAVLPVAGGVWVATEAGTALYRGPR